MYVLDPRDDEDFCHEAWFKSVDKALGSSVRIAFAFRWLSKKHRFFCEVSGEQRHALVPTHEIREAAARCAREREERKAAEAAKAERYEAARVQHVEGRLRTRK